MTGSALKSDGRCGGIASRREVFFIEKGREFEGGRVKYSAGREADGFIFLSFLVSFSLSAFLCVSEGPRRAFWAPVAPFWARFGAFLVTFGSPFGG